MHHAIPFPPVDPEIFSVTIFGIDVALRWYAVAYIVALLFGWWLVVRLMRRPKLWPENRAPMAPSDAEALLTWVVLGVVLGGRLGYVLFYDLGYYLANPLQIPAIWNGGMAFHGGLLGVVLAVWLFCRRNALPLGQVADAMALATPMGLMFGRVANFVNAELWGRPSDVPWAVIFPGAAAQDCPGPEGLVERAWETLCARHPSQLYEAFLEGLVLFIVLLWLVYRRRALKRPWLVTGVFLAGYGLGRFVVEFARQPDAQFFEAHPRGYALWLNDDIGLTMGQLLSLPMVVLGVAIVAYAVRRARRRRPA